MFAREDDDLITLANLHLKKDKNSTFFTISRVWDLLIRCYAKNILTKEQRAAIYDSIKDNTDQTIRNSLKLHVLSINDPIERAKLWESFLIKGNSESLKDKEAQMLAFNNEFSREINKDF